MEVQTPAEQKVPLRQSPSIWQSPAHWVVEQAKGEQSWVCLAGQAPWLLQKAGSVATLSSQEASRHWVSAPGKVQDTPLAPLQEPTQGPSPVQAGRPFWGSPTTGRQVPSLPWALQASHWPLQGLSQHTPSTQ